MIATNDLQYYQYHFFTVLKLDRCLKILLLAQFLQHDKT